MQPTLERLKFHSYARYKNTMRRGHMEIHAKGHGGLITMSIWRVFFRLLITLWWLSGQFATITSRYYHVGNFEVVSSISSSHELCSIHRFRSTNDVLWFIAEVFISGRFASCRWGVLLTSPLFKCGWTSNKRPEKIDPPKYWFRSLQLVALLPIR